MASCSSCGECAAAVVDWYISVISAQREQLAQQLGQRLVAHELGDAHVEVGQQLIALAHVSRSMAPVRRLYAP